MAAQPNATGLPFLSAPHDALRSGLCNLREDALPPHPVEAIQEAGRAEQFYGGGGGGSGSGAAGGGASSGGNGGGNKAAMLRHVYGAAAPARAAIEAQILSRLGRLPGGPPASRLGLESMTGALDTFAFESYLGLPDDAETPPVDLHSQMEARLGLAPGTKPLARGIL